MMGGHHAVTGAAAWLALTGTAEIAGRATGLGVLDGLDTPELLAGTVVATGAALLPDIDHPSATIARSGGPFTKAMSSAVGAAAGHRGGTHTLLAAAVFAAIAALVAALDWRVQTPLLGEVQVGAVLVVTAMTVFGVSALKFVRGPIAPWITGLLVGLVTAAAAPDTSVWLPLAVGVGVVAHLLGDMLTVGGIPFPTWPLVAKPKKGMDSPLWHSNGFVAVPILGRTGSAAEWAFCAVISLYVVVALGAAIWGSLPF